MLKYPRQTEQNKGEKFIKENIDYWIDQARFSGESHKELATLYRAVEGELIAEDYQYILDPYNTEIDRFKNFPARLRNYNILKPVIRNFLGEQIFKPNEFQVVPLNPESTNSFLENLEKIRLDYWNQDFINKLNGNGLATGQPTVPQLDWNEVKNSFTRNWKEERAILGQEALDYIRATCRLEDVYQRALYHWCVSGRVITHRDVAFNDVDVYVVHPRDFWFRPSNTSPFIEDGAAAVHRKPMSLNEIIDRFHDVLSPDQIKQLEEKQGQVDQYVSHLVDMKTEWYIDSTSGDFDTWSYITNSGNIMVYHVQWKTITEVGILTYIDEYGFKQVKEVDRTYEFQPELGDIDISWEYHNEIYEGYKIDDIYIPLGSVPIQRNTLNNASEVKLNYNGRYTITNSGEIDSLVKEGLPYQALRNILMYRREMIINKNKDKIMLMPYGLIPDDLAGDDGADPHEAFLHYLEATGIAWFDESKPNFAAVMQALKGIDLGLGNYIAEMSNMIDKIRDEYWDSIGMNRQRFGQQMASDGKYVTQQALLRSSGITAEYFRMFDQFVETDMNALLDYSKVAWAEGKKGNYLNSENRVKYFEVNGLEYTELDFGVYALNNAREGQKKEAYMSLAHAFAQDPNMSKSVVGKMINSNSTAQIADYIEKAEELQRKITQDKEEKDRETQKYVADVGAQTAAKIDETKRYEIDKRYDAAIDTAIIKAQGDVLGYDAGVNGESDAILIEQLALDRDESGRKLSLEERKQALAERAQKAKENYDQEKLKIDRMKANKPSSSSK
jgi:hypothetical protein